MTVPLWAYQIILALLFVLAGLLLYKMNGSEHDWRIADMFTTYKGGRAVADRQAFMLLGGWFVLTLWGTYWLVAAKELSEWFAMLYAAYCAGSYSYSRWLKSKEEK